MMMKCNLYNIYKRYIETMLLNYINNIILHIHGMAVLNVKLNMIKIRWIEK